MFLKIGFLLATTVFASARNIDIARRSLVVIAAPASDDPYYKSNYDTILDFQALMARRIMGRDNVIIVCDKRTCNALNKRGIPEDHLLEHYLWDIWIRDYSRVGLTKQAQFSFRPNYLSWYLSRQIRTAFNALLVSSGARITYASPIVLDGGNVVDNFDDKAVVTTRVYGDNGRYSQTRVENMISNTLGLKKLAVIPELPGDQTGHADGMVSFIDDNTLAVADQGPKHQRRIMSALREAFGNSVKYVKIPSRFDNSVYDGYVSSCGLHVNALLTKRFLYVPTFGGDGENRRNNLTPAFDSEVLAMIRSETSRVVVPIPVPFNVCKLGGNVRCLTWATSGDTASKLIETAKDR